MFDVNLRITNNNNVTNDFVKFFSLFVELFLGNKISGIFVYLTLKLLVQMWWFKNEPTYFWPIYIWFIYVLTNSRQI